MHRAGPARRGSAGGSGGGCEAGAAAGLGARGRGGARPLWMPGGEGTPP